MWFIGYIAGAIVMGTVVAFAGAACGEDETDIYPVALLAGVFWPAVVFALVVFLLPFGLAIHFGRKWSRR